MTCEESINKVMGYTVVCGCLLIISMIFALTRFIDLSGGEGALFFGPLFCLCVTLSALVLGFPAMKAVCSTDSYEESSFPPYLLLCCLLLFCLMFNAITRSKHLLMLTSRITNFFFPSFSVYDEPTWYGFSTRDESTRSPELVPKPVPDPVPISEPIPEHIPDPIPIPEPESEIIV